MRAGAAGQQQCSGSPAPAPPAPQHAQQSAAAQQRSAPAHSNKSFLASAEDITHMALDLQLRLITLNLRDSLL